MTTTSFGYTGGYASFTVPANVTSISVDVRGAGSGSRNGGRVGGAISVTPGQVLTLIVGGQGVGNSGGTGGAGGFGSGGAGGNGRSANGGDGGGGYSAIRRGSSSGQIVCVAGGAGGSSGDSGLGGLGGGTSGLVGGKGTAGSGTGVTVATGGTQVAPGTFGEYSGGSQNTKGTSGSTSLVGLAGHGGNPGSFNGPGGGGGGGGYYPGGGGGGGSAGFGAGGGGGGGSSYTGGLAAPNTITGGGNTGNGTIVLTYTPSGGGGGGGSKPNTPSILTPTVGQRLRADTVTITATVTSPYSGSFRLAVALFNENTLTGHTDFVASYFGPYVSIASGTTGKTCTVTIPLVTAVQYVAHVFSQDSHTVESNSYATVGFFSNYNPDAPTLISPPVNATFDFTDSIHFAWSHNDPDGENQNGAQFAVYRASGGSAILTRTLPGPTSTFDSNSGAFPSNAFYYWLVRTQDPSGLFSPWSAPRFFYVSGAPTAPLLLSPSNSAGVDVQNPTVYTWRFQDPETGNFQVKADIRFRRLGDTNDADWRNFFGTTTTPGQLASWTLPANTLEPGDSYEWQVRTYDHRSGGTVPSGWSASNIFYGIATPGARAGDLIPTSNQFASTLGCGDNEAYLFVKGGKVLLGRLDDASLIRWNRTRDDISVATVTVSTYNNPLACQLMSIARSWQHEIVIYRDDGTGRKSRAWEGPVTGIEYGPGYVTFTARDVMAWVYRRILKKGFNDSYPNIQTITFRAQRIIIDALARDDPNILPYLTAFVFADDAKESRVIDDYTTTAWQEVDDLAANAGLDYTVVGRRIVLFDTNRAIGKLPMMRSGDFNSDPVISEYGMNLATEYAVTNGAGVYGTATNSTSEGFYGKVELLVSNVAENAAASDATLTATARAALVTSLNSQAARGISDRFPSPLVVRVPDNSSVSPDAPVTIDQLVPGVWVPLQATHVCRSFSQWQKLDNMTVEQTSAGETISVTLSPAPNGGDTNALIDGDGAGVG